MIGIGLGGRGIGLGLGRTAGAFSPLASVPWVAQWKFNNNGNDSIGANHLTAVNSPTFTMGKLGGATGATQLVAASSQYWSIADNAALSMGDVDLTICAWVYLDSKTGYQHIVGKYQGAGNQREYLLRYQLSNDRFFFAVSSDGLEHGTAATANTFGSPSLATWYLVIAWHDSVNNVLGICVDNGVPDTTAYSNGIYDGTIPFNIGRISGDGYYWDGRIDNVCIAKSAAGGGVLTAAQRTAFYNAGVGTEQIT